MDKKKGKQSLKKGGGGPDNAPDIPAEKRAGTKILLGILLLAVVILGLVVVFSSQLTGSAPSVQAGSGRVTVWYFYGNGCEHCRTVTPYVASLQKKYPDVEFHILEIYDNPANRDILIAMNEKHGQKYSGIPVAYVGDVILFGGTEVPERLESVIIGQRT